MMRRPCLSAKELLNVIYGSNEPKKKREEKKIKNFEPSSKRGKFPYGKHPGHFLKDPFSPEN